MSGPEKDVAALLVAWVANVKLIMCLLLVSVALFSKTEDRLLRAAVSFAMCLAIPAYYVTMSPEMHSMEAAARY